MAECVCCLQFIFTNQSTEDWFAQCSVIFKETWKSFHDSNGLVSVMLMLENTLKQAHGSKTLSHLMEFAFCKCKITPLCGQGTNAPTLTKSLTTGTTNLTIKIRSLQCLRARRRLTRLHKKIIDFT